MADRFWQAEGPQILGLVRRAEVLDEVRAARLPILPCSTTTMPPPKRPRRSVAGDRAWRWMQSVVRQADGSPSSSAWWYIRILCGSQLCAAGDQPSDVIFNDLTIRGFSLYNSAFAAQISQAIREAVRGDGGL